MRSLVVPLASLVLALGLTSVAVAQNRPYTDGPVMNVSYIRVKPGMFDKYVKWLATDWKRNMEAQKKEGIILDYAVYSSPQSREGDWNMVLTTTYKNMAALDNLRDRAEPLANRTLSTTPEQRAQETVEREALRDQVGSRLLRQLILR
jgi:hypothetical protein